MDQENIASSSNVPKKPLRQYLRTAFRATHKSEEMLAVQLMARKFFRGRGEYVFISAMPKSASTFLTRSLGEITGFKHEMMTYAFERNEQELYLPKLVDNYNRPTITQQHTRATGPNIELMHRFQIRPVILVRNIFDVVFSIRDYLLKEGVEHFPSLYATKHFASLRVREQHDFLIAFAIPWYFNFYASWFDATRNGRLDTLWVTYEELVEDWAAGISQVMDFYDLEYNNSDIQSVLQAMQKRRSETRINKGVVGRGQTGLTDDQRERIVAMKRFYPWVDFSRIGL